MKATRTQIDPDDQQRCPRCAVATITPAPTHTDENHNEWWTCNFCHLNFWIEHHLCWIEDK